MVAVAGNSLLNLGREIGHTIGPYQELVTSAISSSANNLKISSLIDTEAPPGRYGGYYAFLQSGQYIGQQARVAKNGFAKATGDFTLATLFNESGGVHVAAGVSVDLMGTMPWIDQDGLTGMRTCINRMMQKFWVRHKLPIVSTGDTDRVYDLGAFWWARRDRFLALYDPHDGGSAEALPSSFGWDIKQDGENWVLYIDGSYPVAKTFYLECFRPLNSRLFKGTPGAWLEQASPRAGLDLVTDACLGDWSIVLTLSLYEVYMQMARQAGGARKSYWRGMELGLKPDVSVIRGYFADQQTGLASGPSSGPSTWASAWGTKGLFVD